MSKQINKEIGDYSALLKIHRDFSKDEAVAFMFDRNKKLIHILKDYKQQLGKEKSYVAELEDEIKYLKEKIRNYQSVQDKIKNLNNVIQDLKKTPPTPLEVKKDTLVADYKKQLQKQLGKNKELRDRLNSMTSKYYSLLSKTEK